ncbi:hypothetical protein BsWGS_05870 [Bradybaena similaris]
MGSIHNSWPYIINLGNSIIGVSMLAMPYCFQKCGIILSVVVLVLCTWLTLISCNLLMKAGVTCRRRSYEFLAYHTHGAPGKFISEIGMIGFQLGTLIAQIVVVGDLGPSIVTKIFGIQTSSGLRTFLMVVLCMSVGLPMALIRDIRSVSRVSAVCVTFYCTFVVYVIWLAVPNLWYGDWYEKVYFWRPEGFFQCLPILSFSFGCQTQLFLLYDALPEPSLKAMSSVVNSAVSLCAVAYLMVGFCGYISFYTHDIPGDVIGVFPNVFFTDVMKICFVFSIVITFPVMVFPCRASIYTLLFAKKSKARDEMIELDTHMPARQLKIITFSLVVGSMIIAILIPNVEFILGMNGAVMGTLICYIFPALFFLKVMGSKPEGKNLAQLVLFLGITILLVSTYSTLRSQDKVSTHIDEQAQAPLPVDVNLDSVLLPKSLDVEKIKIKDIETASKQPGDRNSAEVVGDMRKEPPNPHPPDIAKPVEGLKPDHQNDIKRDKIDKENNSAKEIAGGDSDKLAEAGKENVKIAEANKAKELELQEKEKKQGELLAELEKQRNEQKILIEEQRQLLKEFKDHHDKDMKQEAQQQVVAQIQENGVNQPLPQSPSLQPVVIQQQNGQEPVVRPQQSLNNQPDIPSQQLHLLQVNETSHIDNANQQQVMPKGEQKGDQVNIVDTLNSNVKPQDHVVDANVDRQEPHPVHEQSSASQTIRQEVLHLVPVEPPVIFQQSTQFGSQKEHEIKEQNQNQLLLRQETSQDSYKQRPQFQLPQIQN